MFFIPGFLIAAVTFPGVIVHELAHQLFCRLMRVPVFEVKYFQFANPSGYVVHEASEKPLTNFMIAIGPFILNTLLGMILLLPAAIEVLEFKTYALFTSSNTFVGGALRYIPMLVLAWLGISILMHAFPSIGDAGNLVRSILKNKRVNPFVKVLVAPVVLLVYLGALGSMFWLDLGYAIALGMLIPRLVSLFI